MIVPPFATIAEADAYHADSMFADVWENEMETEDKRRALITASRLLLAHVPWLRTYSDWVSVIPQALKDATSEFARRLFENGDPFAPSDTEGIKSFKAGPVDIEFTGAGSVVVAVPPEVIALLASLSPVRGSSINVPIIRY